MCARIVVFACLIPLCLAAAETLGYFEQRFNAIHFQKAKWQRAEKEHCQVYSAKEDGATVEIMRMGTSNLVPFHATKGLSVKICGSTAAFDEGFETPR